MFSCPKCSSPLPENALFCPQCGVGLAQEHDDADKKDCIDLLTSAMRNKDIDESVRHVRTLFSMGEDLLHLSTRLILLTGNELRDNSSYYVEPFFDVKKIRNAPFILPMLRSRDLLFYCDSTIFGRGTTGFALSPTTLFTTAKQLILVPYSSIRLAVEHKGSVSVTCDNDITIPIPTGNHSAGSITFLLNMLSLLWRYDWSSTGTSRELNAAEKRSLKENTLLLNNAMTEHDLNSCTDYLHNLLALKPDRTALTRHVIMQAGESMRDDSSLYAAPFFNAKKMGAATFVSKAMEDHADILLYYDRTTFGKGDEGFVLTDTALYVSGENPLTYSSMRIIEEEDSGIKINDTEFNLTNKGHRMGLLFLLKLLVLIWSFQSQNQNQD